MMTRAEAAEKLDDLQSFLDSRGRGEVILQSREEAIGEMLRPDGLIRYGVPEAANGSAGRVARYVIVAALVALIAVLARVF